MMGFLLHPGTDPECNQVNQNCEGKTPLECFSCGNPVCSGLGCSILVDYLAYGSQRLCLNCIEDRWEDSLALRTALWTVLFDQCRGRGLPEAGARSQASKWFTEVTGTPLKGDSRTSA